MAAIDPKRSLPTIPKRHASLAHICHRPGCAGRKIKDKPYQSENLDRPCRHLHAPGYTDDIFLVVAARPGTRCNMNSANIVWLASYPRSGNTFLRTILWQCFGLRSASLYANDLARNRELEEYVGHIEHGINGQVEFPSGNIPLVKTHGHPSDDNPAIYVVRDGRAASVSLWKMLEGYVPLEAIIEGRQPFGTWSSHVQAWKPYERRNTLLLKYEDMNSNLADALKKISQFLERDILNESIPDRTTIASAEGKWVTTHSDWRSNISDDLLEKFNRLNEPMLKKMGYSL